jgi:RNA polymerase sigma-70 factor (ECF subfamily)
MDKEAFSDRMEEMGDALYGIARTYLKTPSDCADAVQETTLLAWKNRLSLKQEAYFKTWVVRILINECKRILRNAKRVIPVAQMPEVQAPEDADPAVYEAIFSLDIRYRAPFILFHVDGYSTQEIAAMLRLPKGTVTSRLQRARRVLRDILGGDGV